ncbi:hypothetical protein GGS20DRAFT_537892 [Poronia punctata]|nr:hypothetical protein GGS20DRAFT_537892 [Poronia punctata]
MASNHAWKIEIIPWDPASQEHVQRMHEQRVACGWRADEVFQWAELARRGEKLFHWIVLSDEIPNRDKLLEQHFATHPNGKGHLRDTATHVWFVERQDRTERRNREATGRYFIPIGHVALEIHTAEEDAKSGLPPDTIWVHQLFISSALQGGGYGVAAMAHVEAIAAREGKMWMALDTRAKDTQEKTADGALDDVKRGDIVPVTSKEEWYARQGYQTYKQGPGYTYQTADGASIQLNVSYMKKRIGGRTSHDGGCS